mmetsp:Transcript_10234/g.19176  ORF Transcript_10234/g.19176 Transcript_10234/m.19176 type:complete len:161 (+) Transcript_10234:109-591(+)
MPRLPAKQREAEKIATKLSNGSYAAAANDSPVHYSWEQHAKSLLSHINGDRHKRKQTIDKFIAALVEKRVVAASDGHDDVASNNEDHDTNCQVCGDGAELLGCSTCNLAFHLKCARPAMSDIPENEWSSAYCDATGETDLKKDSRHRKKADICNELDWSK